MSAFKELEENIIDGFIEKERKDFQSNLESFEMYKNRTKQKMLKNLDDYERAYNNGYEVIIEELSKKFK